MNPVDSRPLLVSSPCKKEDCVTKFINLKAMKSRACQL